MPGSILFWLGSEDNSFSVRASEAAFVMALIIARFPTADDVKGSGHPRAPDSTGNWRSLAL